MASFPEYKREFKYTNELKANTAYMQLGMPIGYNDESKEPYIIGAIFAEEMYFLKSLGKEVCVKMNCPGGRMFDGWPIMDAVRTTDAEMIGVGLICSMAVPIFLSARKEKRRAMSFAKMMIHPPSGDDDDAKNQMRNSLATVLKETTKYKQAEIDAMLKDGAPDTWLDATEMKRRGIICEVIPTNSAPEVEEKDPYAIYNVYNQFNENNMAEPAKPVTGDATQVQAFLDLHNQLAEVKKDLAIKDAKILELTNSLKAQEDAVKAAKVAGATALVDVAIKNKQINLPADPTAALSMRNQFIDMANTAPDAFKAMLPKSNGTTERQSVLNHVKTESEAHPQGGDDQETYEFLANNNPKKLYAMMDENPEQYTKIVNAYHQSKLNIK